MLELRRCTNICSPRPLPPDAILISVRLRTVPGIYPANLSPFMRMFNGQDTLKPQFNMKALAGLLSAIAALEAYTVVGEALVYTSESWSRPALAGPPSISPRTARLLLAQRLGLSRYHSLQDADESTLDILNTCGGEQQQVFAREDGSEVVEKLLLVVEGVDEGSL